MLGTVVYAGEPGAFGEAASRQRFPHGRPVGLPKFSDVADAIADGRASHGLIPVRNSRAGTVPGADDILRDPRLRVVEQIALPVVMHCVGLPGTVLAGVRIVRSHPVALAQCGRFLAAIAVAAVPTGDTALAARQVREGGDPTVAALASARAAQLHGLAILAAGVQDDPGNSTTFAVLVRAGP